MVEAHHAPEQLHGDDDGDVQREPEHRGGPRGGLRPEEDVAGGPVHVDGLVEGQPPEGSGRVAERLRAVPQLGRPQSGHAVAPDRREDDAAQQAEAEGLEALPGEARGFAVPRPTPDFGRSRTSSTRPPSTTAAASATRSATTRTSGPPTTTTPRSRRSPPPTSSRT